MTPPIRPSLPTRPVLRAGGRGWAAAGVALALLMGTRLGAQSESGYLVELAGPPLAEVELAPGFKRLGPSDAKARREARALEIRDAQDRLEAGVGALGGRVGARFRVLNHGAYVRIPPDAAARVAKLPGVVRVVPERHHRPLLDTSTRWVGAPAVWPTATAAGVSGEGIRIGIIDSGIDYRHVHLGGTGDTATNDPVRIEPGTFPTAKVVGGWDFVGDAYDSGGRFGSSVARPDPDPIDPASHAHGTHVAGIAAGLGVLSDGTAWGGPRTGALPAPGDLLIGPGIAPAARLYALKVFGPNARSQTSSAHIVAALNRAADPDGDGSTSDRLDVVNLSLGTPFGADEAADPEVAAVDRLSRLGCVVVVAAGNTGNTSFSVWSPGTSRRAVTVANAHDDGFTRPAIRVESPGDLAGELEVGLATFGPSLSAAGPVTAQVAAAQPAAACSALLNTAAVQGKVVLIDRGECFFTEKFRRAQAAGAVAVLMVNNVDGPPIPMGFEGDVSDIRIPGVMVSREDGSRIRARLGAGVTVTLDDTVLVGHPELAGTLYEGSARGPAHPTALPKPDLSAPGTEVVSAAAGGGTRGRAETGTSMSAPHVAGAAALLRQLRPRWPSSDLKAALLNTARPMSNAPGAAYPLSRAGAGRLDVAAAAATEVVARHDTPDGTTAVSFGVREVSVPEVLPARIRLVNHGTSAVEYAVSVEPVAVQPGAVLAASVPTVRVPAGSEAVVDVELRIDPALWVPVVDPTSPAELRGRPRRDPGEVGGRVWFRSGDRALQVPWHGLIRPAGTQLAGGSRIGTPRGAVVDVPVGVRGGRPVAGARVGLFQPGFSLGPSSSTLPSPAGSLVAWGAASDLATAGSLAGTRVYFGVALAEAWLTPQREFVAVDVEVDLDADGRADRVISNSTTGNQQAGSLTDREVATDAFIPVVRDPLAAGLTDAGVWNGLSPLLGDPAPFQNAVMVLSAPATDLGLGASRSRFRYRVVAGPFPGGITGWAEFDAAAPWIDPSPHGLAGTPWQEPGRGVAVRLHRDRAAAAGFGAFQPVPVLLLHLHNRTGLQAEGVRLEWGTPDADLDGLDDAWEITALGDLDSDGAGDRDADGMADRGEWVAGTDPLDPGSVLRTLPPDPATGRVAWTSVPGRIYTLLRSGALAGAFEPVAGPVPGSAGTTAVVDPDLRAGDGPYFYRVEVRSGAAGAP